MENQPLGAVAAGFEAVGPHSGVISNFQWDVWKALEDNFAVRWNRMGVKDETSAGWSRIGPGCWRLSDIVGRRPWISGRSERRARLILGGRLSCNGSILRQSDDLWRFATWAI